MLVDTITLVEGAEIINLTCASGTADPGTPTIGELFYRTDLSALRVYNGSAWGSVGGGGSGTVTSVSVSTANGVSGSVATATTTPAITLTLGAITPTSVAASGTVTGSNVSGSTSGTNTGDQTITLTGDVTGTGTGSFATTLASVATAGTTGSGTLIPVITINAKGLVTSITTAANPQGTVTSVAATGSTGLTVGGSPITASGTLTFTLGTELQGLSALSANGFVQRTGAGTYTSAALTSGQITTALTYTPVNKAGDSVSGTLTFSAGTVTGLAAPTNASDAATKSYVDSVAAGLTPKQAVIAASTAALTVTQSGSGVGATLTNAGAQAAFAVDGQTLSVGNRVLIKNQSTGTQNGIYSVTTVGTGSTNWVLTRTADFDGSPANEVASGDTTFVETGTTQATTFWVLTTGDPITVDTTALTFTQYGGPGSYSAGTGLTLTGTVFSLPSVGTSGTYTSVTTDGQGRVTSGTNPGFLTSAVTSITGTANQIAASASTGAVTLSMPVNVIIPTPSSGVALTATAVTGQAVAVFNGADSGSIVVNSTSATNRSTFTVQQAGVSVARLGTDGTQTMLTDSANGDLCLVSIGKAIRFGQSAAASQLTISTAGNATLAAPSSGVTLSITSASGAGGITINGTDSARIIINSSATTTSASITLQQATTVVGRMGIDGTNTLLSDSANGDLCLVSVSKAVRIGNTAAGTTSMVISAGNVTINAPASGIALTSTGGASQYAIQVTGNTGTGTSRGLFIQAGTNSSDVAFAISNAANTLSYAAVLGDGSGYIGYNGSNHTIAFAAAGNVTINAPTSGTTLTLNGVNSSSGAINLASGLLMLAGSAGTSGQVLTSGGASAVPTWATPGAASSATNVAGGTAGSIVYQSAASTTGFIADVATGQVLTSGGVGVVPAWSASPTFAGTNLTGTGASFTAGLATNISGGATNQIPYQSAASTTAFSAGFTWTNSTDTLTLGIAGTGPTINATAGTTAGNTFAINGSAAGTAGQGGGNVTITAGTGLTSGTGGSVGIVGGAVGTTGVGGAVNIAGAAGGSTSGSGGGINLTSGGSSVTGSSSFSGTIALLTGVGGAVGGAGTGPITLTTGTSGTNVGISTGAITLTTGSLTQTNGSAVNAGNVSLIGGNVNNAGTAGGSGGNILITAGSATGASTAATGGSVTISTGVSASSTAGTLTFKTGTTSSTAYFSITPQGAFGVGSGATSYGSAGQVLTSGGNSTTPPTWSTPGGVTSITGTANQIAASASTGAVTLSMPVNVIIPTPSSGTALTMTGSNATSSTTPTCIINGNATGSFGNALLSIIGSGAGTYGYSDIKFQLAGLATSIANIGMDFNANIMTGSANGDLVIQAYSAGAGGRILFGTGSGVAIVYSINGSGAHGVGSTPNYGTSGQVFTSAGSSAVPTWSTPAVVSVAGTANQIAASTTSGAVTLSMPSNVIIPTPASGVALTMTGSGDSSSEATLVVNGHATSHGQAQLNIVGQTFDTLGYAAIRFYYGATLTTTIGTDQLSFLTGSASNDTVIFNSTGSNRILLSTSATGAINVAVNSTGAMAISAPTSGVALTVSAVSGTHSTKIADSANNSFNAGFLEIPQNSKAAAYELVLADSGKHIYLTTSATISIPGNATGTAPVAFPIGTTITFACATGATMTITAAASSTDTVIFSPGGTTGTRTLAPFGMATMLKVTATSWMISGSGLT